MTAAVGDSHQATPRLTRGADYHSVHIKWALFSALCKFVRENINECIGTARGGPKDIGGSEGY